MANADQLLAILGESFGRAGLEMDAELIDRTIGALAPIAADDVVVVMAGPDDSFIATGVGPDGLREAWRDWLEAFARVRLEVESMERHGDNLLAIARQVGTTRHGGVEIEQPSAAVWKLRDGLIVRVEFHLDREKALASAREPA